MSLIQKMFPTTKTSPKIILLSRRLKVRRPHWRHLRRLPSFRNWCRRASNALFHFQNPRQSVELIDGFFVSKRLVESRIDLLQQIADDFEDGGVIERTLKRVGARARPEHDNIFHGLKRGWSIKRRRFLRRFRNGRCGGRG